MNWRYTVRDSDPSAVRKLVADTGFFSAGEVDLAVDLVDETLQKGSASGYEFLFLDNANGGLQGYVCYGPIPATKSSYDLYWIAVSPDLQGAGLGAQLVAETEQKAKAFGATRMYVDTSGRAQYRPTRSFYERCGYTVAAELDDFYAPGDSKVIYQKTLAG